MPTTASRRRLVKAGAALLLTTSRPGAAPATEQRDTAHAAQDAAPNAALNAAARRQAENLAVIERYVAALRSGNVPAAIALYHPDLTLHWYGHQMAGTYKGKADALKKLAEFSRRTQRMFTGFVDVMAGPQRATMISREALTRSGERIEVERVLVFACQDQLLHECWVYDADPQLIDRYMAG